MKFSIITPEHDPNNIPYLMELYDSILDQTYTDWEWILYLNNKCLPVHLPRDILDNPKVFVHVAEDSSKDIGHIKNKAFHLGTGDVLVEVDHDDMITPNCLQRLYDVYSTNAEAGFVYSDNATMHMDGEFIPYNAAHGWTYDKFMWKGQELTAMNSFEPSAQAISYIWYAPDHVRSWRKDVYHQIGGHNTTLSICDDHELMIRTYLNTRMVRIPEVLYIYRVTGDNTWLERNEAIQIKTVELYDQYSRLLAERDADLRGLQKVELGGGRWNLQGYTNIDLSENADIRHDLNEGIPLPDNSVGVLFASHIIEHLHDKTKTMEEIYRVLAPGGQVFIEVPSTDGRGAFQDPTHVSYWNENSFLYYTDGNMAQYIDNFNIRFQQYKMKTWYPNQFMENLQALVVTAIFTAIKDPALHEATGAMQRYPGELKI